MSSSVLGGDFVTSLLALSGPTFSVVRQAERGGGERLRDPDAKNQG